MSVNLKQVYNAIHDLGREIVMLESLMMELELLLKLTEA